MIALLGALALSVLGIGCGQKGDLYLPTKASPTSDDAPSAQGRMSAPG